MTVGILIVAKMTVRKMFKWHNDCRKNDCSQNDHRQDAGRRNDMRPLVGLQFTLLKID
jgi:hypothetical protein